MQQFHLSRNTSPSFLRFGRFELGVVTILLWFFVPVSPGQENANKPTVPTINGVFVKPVPGAPFSGTVQVVSRQTLADGSVFVLRTINQIARDSAGRTHNESRRLVAESYKQEPLLSSVHIYDPVTGFSTHLDPFTFLAKQTAMHAPPVPSAKAVPDPNPKSSGSPVKRVDDLGTRTFNGLVLHGTRQSRDATDFDEFWYSPDFSIFMIHIHKDPVWEQTVEVTNFTPREPDPSNFTIPADYKIVEVAEESAAPDASGIYHVGKGIVAPQLVYAPDPKFTEQARAAKYGGTAVVSLVVDAQGNPQNVQVIRHLQMGLDEEALAAVRHYKFKPGTMQGKPVPVAVDIKVTFRIY